jgi:hypothetical protein
VARVQGEAGPVLHRSRVFLLLPEEREGWGTAGRVALRSLSRFVFAPTGSPCLSLKEDNRGHPARARPMRAHES